jgi:DNA replication protein DnaC
MKQKPENCWAKLNCKGYPNQCGWYCVGFNQLSNLYELSHMPIRYQRNVVLNLEDTDEGAKDRGQYLFLKQWLENVEENVNMGNGLYIHSKGKGNGKTAWSCKIVNQYFMKVALKNNMRCRGIFVNVPAFLQELRDAMDNPSEELNEKVNNIRSADIVVWDDIGTENPSNWVRERLYDFINHRYSNEMTQIFTSNMTLDELAHEKFMGERIVSRIKGQCQTIEFFQSDRRSN